MLSNGQVLSSRYQIIGKLSMGAVYEAIDMRLSAPATIKETLSGEDHLKAAFRREAQLLANLNHPALPNVIDPAKYFPLPGKFFGIAPLNLQRP